MKTIFGKNSDIFSPPYNRFNKAAVNAIKELGIKIMSSSILDQYGYDLGLSISREKNRTLANLKEYTFCHIQLT
jgi:hypothetical protein